MGNVSILNVFRKKEDEQEMEATEKIDVSVSERKFDVVLDIVKVNTAVEIGD